MCTLCRKVVCTIARILGASKVSLLQRRYALKHDAVLRYVIEAVKTFISNIEEAVPISTIISASCVRLGSFSRS